MPQLVIETLRTHRQEQKERRLQLGPAYKDHGLIFCQADGRPWLPNKFTTHILGFCRRRGFKGLRFHDLRHTHATQLLKEGVHPKVVSERLGHATVAITLDTYSHVLPGLQRRLAAVGRTAFSNYILHSVLCTLIFYGHGLGLFGHAQRWHQLLIVFGIWALQLWLAPWWLARYRYGPLEWSWPVRRTSPKDQEKSTG